jgi:hypothetical protein
MLQQTDHPTPNHWSRAGAALGAIPGIIVDSFLTTFGVASAWGYSEAVSLRDDETNAYYWRILTFALTACSFTRQCATIYHSEPNQYAQITFPGAFFKAVGYPYSTLKRQFLHPSAPTPTEIEDYYRLQSVEINQ